MAIEHMNIIKEVNFKPIGVLWSPHFAGILAVDGYVHEEYLLSSGDSKLMGTCI